MKKTEINQKLFLKMDQISQLSTEALRRISGGDEGCDTGIPGEEEDPSDPMETNFLSWGTCHRTVRNCCYSTCNTVTCWC